MAKSEISVKVDLEFRTIPQPCACGAEADWVTVKDGRIYVFCDPCLMDLHATYETIGGILSAFKGWPLGDGLRAPMEERR